jgi:hypothetical protein
MVATNCGDLKKEEKEEKEEKEDQLIIFFYIKYKIISIYIK